VFVKIRGDMGLVLLKTLDDCFYCPLELFTSPSMVDHCSFTTNKAGSLKIKGQRYTEPSAYFGQSKNNTLKRKDTQLDHTLEE
jgi:hypothetical protein